MTSLKAPISKIFPPKLNVLLIYLLEKRFFRMTNIFNGKKTELFRYIEYTTCRPNWWDKRKNFMDKGTMGSSLMIDRSFHEFLKSTFVVFLKQNSNYLEWQARYKQASDSFITLNWKLRIKKRETRVFCNSFFSVSLQLSTEP